MKTLFLYNTIFEGKHRNFSDFRLNISVMLKKVTIIIMFGSKGGILRGILLGIKKHPLKALVYLFASFSVLWTIVEGLTYFLPSLDLRGLQSLVVILLVGIAYSAFTIRRPSHVHFSIDHSNTSIQIKFSDLFSESGYKAIAVNEYFDSEIGLPVSEKSLHGIFILKCFGGHQQAFDQIVSEELSGILTQRVNRVKGKNTRYPIGTTAVLPVNNEKYLCFALCETDIQTCKAKADIPTLWRALEGLYDKARVILGGSELVLPLVGSGLSGIGLPARDLLDLIILSIITATKKNQITNHIKIILANDRIEEIDLREVERYWR
jgi:hypothetical protein